MVENLLEKLYNFIFKTSAGTMVYGTLMVIAGIVMGYDPDKFVAFLLIGVGYVGGFALWSHGMVHWNKKE